MRKISEKPLLTLIEAGGVNDMPVIVPVAATSDMLIKAIETVKAAGYRVSKPRKSKIFKRGEDRVGPTFVCEFSDGETARISCFTSLENLDWSRGERLARHAWASRRKVPLDWDSAKLTEIAPPISACRFERDGVVLAQRNGGGVA